MTTSNLSFPIRHISVRVPWHDRGWEGTVCADPANNSACLKLPRIAENKDEAAEASAAGSHFSLEHIRTPTRFFGTSLLP